jgi:hypothetical protein
MSFVHISQIAKGQFEYNGCSQLFFYHQTSVFTTYVTNDLSLSPPTQQAENEQTKADSVPLPPQVAPLLLNADQ